VTARVIGVELAPERAGVVIADQDERLAGREGVIDAEDGRVLVRPGQRADVEFELGHGVSLILSANVA
jgi:hypothetical protein